MTNLDIEFDPDKITNPDLRFAKGGLAVDNQVKKMYNEGGFADDGATVEPVTGNRVPPGSLDQEVRDDVDAKLSEGEYVIPADVVRFMGLGQIERMVEKAKRGLEDMDANGRIGGEPVDAEGVPIEEDEELTPEEMQMLSEALGETTGMASGGMVQPQSQGIAAQFSPQTVGNQFSQTQSTTGGETPFGNMEIVEYINTDTGQTMMVTLLNGNPLGSIPDGFVRSSEQAMKKPEAPTEINPEVDKGQDYERDTGDSDQRRREIEEDKKNSNTWAEENYEAILDDPVGYVKEQLEVSRLEEGVQKYGARAGALLNPLLGGVGAVAAAATALDPLAKARGTRDFMKELGMDTSEVDSQILDYEDSLPGGIDTLGDIFATGKNRKASLLEIHQARSGSIPTTSSPKVTPTSRAITTSSGSDGGRDRAVSRANELSGGSNAKVSTDSMGVTRATSKGSSGSASVTVGSAAPKTTTSRPQSRPSKSPASSATDSRGRTSEDKDFGREGFNRGGLVAKPSNYKSKVTKKKQKSRRGLGSK